MKVAVAITGASGAVYAQRLIKKLEESSEIEQIAVIFSDNGLNIYNTETPTPLHPNEKIKIYPNNTFAAPFASGSSTYSALIVCPCSCGTLGRIANGISDSLITRAADVMLKERRKLILVTRETPLSLIHIQNMERITLAGGIICPASPSFYSSPTTIENLTDTIIYRILSLIGIKNDGFRWQE